MSVMEVTMEKRTCMEVTGEDERSDVAVEDVMVVSYDGRTLVVDIFLSCVFSLWAPPQLWVKWQRPTDQQIFHCQT